MLSAVHFDRLRLEWPGAVGAIVPDLGQAATARKHIELRAEMVTWLCRC